MEEINQDGLLKQPCFAPFSMYLRSIFEVFKEENCQQENKEGGKSTSLSG
jgi:hypothetical protein